MADENVSIMLTRREFKDVSLGERDLRSVSNWIRKAILDWLVVVNSVEAEAPDIFNNPNPVLDDEHVDVLREVLELFATVFGIQGACQVASRMNSATQALADDTFSEFVLNADTPTRKIASMIGPDSFDKEPAKYNAHTVIDVLKNWMVEEVPPLLPLLLGIRSHRHREQPADENVSIMLTRREFNDVSLAERDLRTVSNWIRKAVLDRLEVVDWFEAEAPDIFNNPNPVLDDEHVDVLREVLELFATVKGIQMACQVASRMNSATQALADDTFSEFVLNADTPTRKIASMIGPDKEPAICNAHTVIDVLKYRMRAS